MSVQNQPQDLWEWHDGHSSLTWVDIVFCLEPSSNPNPLFAAASFLPYSLAPLPYLWILSLPTLTEFLFLQFHKETKTETVLLQMIFLLPNAKSLSHLISFQLFSLEASFLAMVALILCGHSAFSVSIFFSLLFPYPDCPKWSCSQHWVLRPLPF